MFSSIKTKLLVICGILVLLTTISLSSVYYRIAKQETHRESQKRIQIAFDIIFDDLDEQVRYYSGKVGEFLQDEEGITMAVRLTAQGSSINQAVRQYMISSLATSGYVSSVDRLAIYSKMNVFSITPQVLEHLRRQEMPPDVVAALMPLKDRIFLTEDDFVMAMKEAIEQDTIMTYKDQIWEAARQESLTLLVDHQRCPEESAWEQQDQGSAPFPELFPGSIPERTVTSFFREGRQVGIRVISPIVEQENAMGIIIGDVFFSQESVVHYAELSQTEVNVFAGTDWSLGTLSAQTAFATNALDTMTACENMSETFEVLPVVCEEQHYYQGRCALTGARDAPVGVITVSLSQQVEAQEIRKMVSTVSTIASLVLLASGVLIVGLVVPTFTKPIIVLTQASKQIASGNLDQSIDTGGRDELGILARGFAHMRDEVKRTIQELQHLNDELEQRVEERTAEVVRQKYILDAFMANVPDSICFKDCCSRFTHVNQATLSRLGLNAPGELLGKSDFDFFPEEIARCRYEQEQQIIRTGEPLLDFEETDSRGHWMLTTRMPLRDERGEIIGTFGISRDITELKQAQKALEAAHTEVTLLNEQLKEENVRMGAQLDVARRLQEMILPTPEEFQQIEGLEFVGYMQPADEVGGDYYDVLNKNDITYIGIGDVTGHGLESGVLMLMTQTAIRTLIEHGETDPVAFVNTLNRTIYKNVQRMRAERSLTFVLVNYQPGRVKIVGQHEEILVVRQNGQIERVDTLNLGFPVGLVDDISEWVTEATVSLEPGDGIVLYTDGITEAENLENEHYGLERLCAVINQHWQQPVEMVRQAVIDDVMKHIGKQKVYDDLTLVIMKHREPSPIC